MNNNRKKHRSKSSKWKKASLKTGRREIMWQASTETMVRLNRAAAWWETCGPSRPESRPDLDSSGLPAVWGAGFCLSKGFSSLFEGLCEAADPCWFLIDSFPQKGNSVFSFKPNNSSSSSTAFGVFTLLLSVKSKRCVIVQPLCWRLFHLSSFWGEGLPHVSALWALWSPGWLCPSPVDHAWSVFSLHISLSLNVRQRCSFVWSRIWADLLVRAVAAQKITKTQQTSKGIKGL